MVKTGTLTALFQELVRTAMSTQRVTTSETTEFYLVQLLEAFARPDRANLLDPPLGLDYLEALHLPPRQRHGRLRRVADTALFVSGVFFDNLRDGECGLGLDQLVAFALDVGGVLPSAYEPIVERRRGLSYGERERRLQLARRGRYVEFNLVHDRGTTFGLQTNARIESVLMSLPPLASWEYAPVYEPGSFEAALMAMLEPRDWVGHV